ncbi:Ig-like domain-containing protein [Providencia rettgeri]|nr:Ig-like domain-containing protein [Providencia rettgeri]MDL9989358.1 Ig-like domain-containing protein [Providencia rettgeri]
MTKHNTPTFAGQTEANSTVTLQIAEQELVTTADAQGRWRVTVEKPLADKQHSYTVTAVDVAGNTKTVAETVTIKTTLPDATAQLKYIQGFVTNQNKPTFMGTTDPYSTVNAVVGQKKYEAKSGENGEWSIQLNELADNVYTYRVIVTDLAGNKNEFSDILQIDTQLPSTAATFTEGSDSGVPGDNITHHKSPALTGKTKPHAAVTISIENENGSYETTANANGEWTQALPTEFTEGEHTYTVSVIDKAGNQATSKGTFTVDTEVESLSVGLEEISDSGIRMSISPELSLKSREWVR